MPATKGVLAASLRRLRDLHPHLVALAPALVALLGALWALTAVHLTFFSPAVPVNPKDEGYINALAMRMLGGHFLPYVDGVSHRGPMLYWVAAIASGLGHRMTFVPIRTLAMLCSLLMVVLTFASAVRARRPLAGAFAAILIAVTLVLELPPDDGLAYNGEPLLDVFALGGLLCLAIGLAPERARPGVRWVAAAGLLAALGVLTKQVGAVTLVAFALWPTAACLARPSGERGWRRWRLLLALVAGAMAPVAVVLARYALAGELHTFFFYVVTYNSKYYMAPYTASEAVREYRLWITRHAGLLTIGAILVASGIARALAGGRAEGWARAVDRRGFLLVVSVCAGLSGAVANATLRDFPHYYVQAIPWFALLLGLLLEEALGTPRALVQAGVLAPTAAVMVLAILPRLEEYREAQSRRPGTLPICTYVAEHSRSGDSIYVWGFAADIYTYCKRQPASRFVYSTFQSGYVPYVDPPREVERTRVVPGSPGLFLADLEASRARLVIDVPSTLAGRSMDETPAYADYLATRYCPPAWYDGVRVFRRRAEEGTCAP